MASSNDTFQFHNNQDYKKIRGECLKDCNRLWDDSSYTATFNKRSDWDWKRPGEIMRNPYFIKAGNKEAPSRFNSENINLARLKHDSPIMHNLAAISALTLQPKIFRFVVPEDNEEFSSENYVGVFHFRFWRYGKICDVVVDDRLPTCGGKLVSFLKNGHPEEFWPFLLEKAYTKLCGSAESLSTTTVQDFVVDITGSVSELYASLGHPKPISQLDLETTLYKSLERDALIIFERHWHNNNENVNIRKVNCITKAIYVDNDQSDHIMLLRIFMPFETILEDWKGFWNEKSDEWQSIPESKKKELDVSNNYESWILFSEFHKHDWDIYIFHLYPHYINDWGDESHRGLNWCQTLAEGKWVKGVSCGGNRRDHLATFHLNPQFQISFKSQNDETSDSTIIISLLQKTHKSDRLAMDIYVFKLKHHMTERLDKEFFKHNNPILDSFPLRKEREVSSRYSISPGEYCIVLAANKPSDEASFILRVLSEHTVIMNVLNEKVTQKDIDVRVSIKPPLSRDESLQVQEFDSSVRDFFESVSGEEKVVGWKGLKTVLDFAMDCEVPTSKKYSVRNSIMSYVFPSNSVFDTIDGREFSKDLTRSLLATADLDHSGKVSYHEFQGLWAQIRQWMNVYELHSNDNGYLPKEYMRDALDSAGFQLSSDILSNLAVRYSNSDGVIPFDDFLMCTSKLRTVFDYFRGKDSDEDTEKTTFSLEEWLQKSIYS